jgi:hypothetical protein
LRHLSLKLRLFAQRSALLACYESEAPFSTRFQMRQAGIEGTLDQIFTCPDLVKEALCDAAMLQKSVSPARCYLTRCAIIPWQSTSLVEVQQRSTFF